jgi:hypothetical protein
MSLPIRPSIPLSAPTFATFYSIKFRPGKS